MRASRASVRDVAEYILRRQGAMSAMKLQKLVYYCQAWSLVWDDRRLFAEPIQAWTNGPVAPALYHAHRGLFTVEPGMVNGDVDNLDEDGRDTIDTVLDYYGSWNAQQLSDLSHAEQPWVQARSDLAHDERGSKEISLVSMAEYYSGLIAD